MASIQLVTVGAAALVYVPMTAVVETRGPKGYVTMNYGLRRGDSVARRPTSRQRGDDVAAVCFYEGPG